MGRVLYVAIQVVNFEAQLLLSPESEACLHLWSQVPGAIQAAMLGGSHSPKLMVNDLDWLAQAFLMAFWESSMVFRQTKIF